MKDNFSTASDKYAQFRPTYPPELFSFLRKLSPTRHRAWDCGTGNGQVAGELADFFEEVRATDISVNQLSQAIQKPNISYTKQAAEKTNFPDEHFDLITVAQAVHWFDFDMFYAEAKRLLKKKALIAVFGYGLFRSNAETDEVIQHFYENVIGPYWDSERRYLDEKYETIPFPFDELEPPKFEINSRWTLERLIGYLKTWSAVKHYEKQEGKNPVVLIEEDLKRTFGEVGEIRFPVLMRVGRNS